MALKVIGAGLGRTGTASLKLALEMLLSGRCYHMAEALGTAGHLDRWLDVAAGRPDWDGLFEGYVATVDFPGAIYWQALADHYPGAKIVLSVRDPERWFASTQETIFSTRFKQIQAGTKWAQMSRATTEALVGGDVNDRATVIAAFDAHNAQVRSAFGPDRLLVFEARDGWDPLCGFLGVPVPECGYPHVNSSAEFESLLALLASPLGARAMDGKGLDRYAPWTSGGVP